MKTKKCNNTETNFKAKITTTRIVHKHKLCNNTISLHT